MDIQKLNQLIDEALNVQDNLKCTINKESIDELADSRFCGIEITDDICTGSIQDKINWMLNKIDKTSKNDIITGYKLSKVKVIERENYFTHEKKTYYVTITMGATDKDNIIKPTTGFGLYHLKHKQDSYKKGKNHWKESKEILKNHLQAFIDAPVEDYFDDKGNIRPAKVQVNINGKFFLIGLSGYGNIYDNETILITCFNKQK